MHNLVVKILTSRLRLSSQIFGTKISFTPDRGFKLDILAESYHNEYMLATLKQTAELVELFRARGVKQTFRKGDFIIRPGDSPHGVYYIYQGLVKAYELTKDK